MGAGRPEDSDGSGRGEDSNDSRRTVSEEHVSEELDLDRLAELPAALGRELSEIVAILLRELSDAFADLEAAIQIGDLGAAGRAAHSARNSALMIDAQPLLAGLADLEAHVRAGDMTGARIVHGGLRERWPRLRARLTSAASAGTGGS
jgi:hypothetical protein